MSPKKATTIEEQIAKLDDRGMKIDDPEKAIHFLNHVNYYRIGSYTFPFEKTYPNKKNRTHDVKDGTKFSDVISLYFFDRELRSLILKYTSIFEVSFKTKVINIVSNYYKDDNAWYVDPKIVRKDYIKIFKKNVLNDKNFNSKKSILSFKLKHGICIRPYAWITLEHVTLGSVVKLYKNLINSDLKTLIANEFKIPQTDTFTNYLEAIVFYRNHCAHESVIFDLGLVTGINTGPKKLVLPMIRNKLSAFIAVIEFFLKIIDENKYTELVKERQTIFEKYTKIETLKPIIEKCTGFSIK